MFDLKDKTILVTGGGSGIGEAISTLFARQGGLVYIIDVNKQAAGLVIAGIREQGGKARFIHCDITSQAEVTMTVEKIVKETGVVDILINNAGIPHIGTVESTEDADMDRLFSVNVKGAYHIIRAAIPHMKARGGAIVNMASVASSVGLSDRFAYSMTKGAVVGMTLSVARDYLSYNIRCNCLSPARVHTPFVDGFLSKSYPGQEEEMFRKLSASQPIGRMGRPEEIAFMALYLCSDEASFVTGCDYFIDGGFTRLNT
ncbi:MAG TPA: SDR family oxidoreductase [Puia sp.]|nr:SDR family oxidoreductase [Puia sp.]